MVLRTRYVERVPGMSFPPNSVRRNRWFRASAAEAATGGESGSRGSVPRRAGATAKVPGVTLELGGLARPIQGPWMFWAPINLHG